MSFCSWRSEEIYKDNWKSGIYVCSQCDHELFSSRTKFEHHSPWPSFTETIHSNSVTRRPELHDGHVSQKALKVLCGKCGNGLGHEFLKDGPQEKSRF